MPRTQLTFTQMKNCSGTRRSIGSNTITESATVCGGCYLWLLGFMRVALVDHLDRSTKCLLRGSNGTLTGWQLDPREPQHSKHGDIHLKYPPKALIVQFDECSWTLDGMPTPGAYPVKKLRVDRKYEKRKREEEQGSDQCD